MWKFLIILLSLLFVVRNSEAANILAIFPTASISHQVVFRAYTNGLAAKGHSLTIVTTDPIETNNPNITQIDFHFTYEMFRNSLNFVEFKEKKMDEFGMMELSSKLLTLSLTEHFENSEIQELIRNYKNYKFDAVVVEFLYYVPWYAFAELFNAPLIGITSLDTFGETHELLGNTANPILHPELLFPFSVPLTFEQRYRTVKFYLYTKFYYKSKFNRIHDDIIRKNFPTVKTTAQESKGRIQLMMTNTHPALGFTRPLVPTTIQLGFMHIEPPKQLEDVELKRYLDESKNGVIYMSLGSNVRSSDLNEGFLSIFYETFKALDYDVLWKWEIDVMANKPENVRISKWLPQADLLAHPRIKMFITQGGQQSMEEAIDRMVPLIVIPFLADQNTNAKRIEQRKIGVQLDLHTINQQRLKNAIMEVLKPEYKLNIQKLRQIVHDQPMKPVDKAVWWTEYVIRHNGTKHLEYVAKNVPFHQKYMLDFIAIAFGITFCLYSFLAFAIKVGFKSKNKKMKKN